MTCSHGTHTALYVVNGVGYCKAQKAEAEAAMKRLGNRKTGNGHTPRWTAEQIAENEGDRPS